MPKNRPVSAAAPKARKIEYGAITGWTPAIWNWLPTMPTATPQAAEQRHEHGLGQELREDVAAARADRLADADLARALGDLTSMMFITPMPPTSSEIAATSPSSVVNTLVVELDASSSDPWLITWKPGSTVFLIVASSRICVTSDSAAFSDVGLAWTVIELIGAVAGQRVLDGGDRRHRDVVLVGRAVRALRGDHPDDLEVAAVDLDVLADRALPVEQFLHDRLADHRHALGAC